MQFSVYVICLNVILNCLARQGRFLSVCDVNIKHVEVGLKEDRRGQNRTRQDRRGEERRELLLRSPFLVARLCSVSRVSLNFCRSHQYKWPGSRSI